MVKTVCLQYLNWSGLAEVPWMGTTPSTTQRDPGSSLSLAAPWQWSHSQQQPPSSKLGDFSFQQVSLQPLHMSQHLPETLCFHTSAPRNWGPATQTSAA